MVDIGCGFNQFNKSLVNWFKFYFSPILIIFAFIIFKLNDGDVFGAVTKRNGVDEACALKSIQRHLIINYFCTLVPLE